MAIDETLMKSDEKAVFALRSLYQRFGYTRFKMSKFEEYDLYVQNKDFLVSDGIITFTDTNGRLKALKPDVTLSIINNSKDTDSVQKLYYNENVYRISGSSHTYKEIMQTGLECIGNIGRFEICEVLSLAMKSLETIDSHCILELSHVGLIEAAFDELQLPKALRSKIIVCINRKNSDDLKSICADNGLDQAAAEKIAVFTGNYKDAEEAFKAVENAFCSTAVAEALNEFKEIFGIIKAAGNQVKLTVDFSCIGGMSYYSGVVFKGYINNIPDAVLSGGQYDKLLRKMHRLAGAIGVAVYLDALEKFDRREKEYDVDTVLIYGDDISAALKTSEMLSAGGNSVLACGNVPQNIRYRQLIKLGEKGLETVYGND